MASAFSVFKEELNKLVSHSENVMAQNLEMTKTTTAALMESARSLATPAQRDTLYMMRTMMDDALAKTTSPSTQMKVYLAVQKACLAMIEEMLFVCATK
jgi:hypothetical protein